MRAVQVLPLSTASALNARSPQARIPGCACAAGTPPSSAETATIAVAGNNSDAGELGDIINCLIPYSDDILIFGGDAAIWLMRGDPMDGGQIDLLTDSVGMAWGRPWCRDPYGVIYFFGSRGGVYQLDPSGRAPTRISQAIDGSHGIASPDALRLPVLVRP